MIWGMFCWETLGHINVILTHTINLNIVHSFIKMVFTVLTAVPFSGAYRSGMFGGTWRTSRCWLCSQISTWSSVHGMHGQTTRSLHFLNNLLVTSFCRIPRHTFRRGLVESAPSGSELFGWHKFDLNNMRQTFNCFWSRFKNYVHRCTHKPPCKSL